MNREDPYRDQAEKLRKKIDRNPEFEKILTEKSELPPRSRLHREKRQKNKWKIKYPMISLLALFFILLPITIYSMSHSWNLDKLGNAEKAAKTDTSYETVGFENEDETKGTKLEERDPEDQDKEDDELDKNENHKTVITPVPNSQVADNSGKNDTVSTDKTSSNENEEQNGEESKQEEKEKVESVYHTVKANETIYRIAMNYYKSPAGIEIIKKANNLKNNDIQAGQVLEIPKNK